MKVVAVDATDRDAQQFFDLGPERHVEVGHAKRDGQRRAGGEKEPVAQRPSSLPGQPVRGPPAFAGAGGLPVPQDELPEVQGQQAAGAARFRAAQSGTVDVEMERCRSAGTPVSGCESQYRDATGIRVYTSTFGRYPQIVSVSPGCG